MITAVIWYCVFISIFLGLGTSGTETYYFYW